MSYQVVGIRPSITTIADCFQEEQLLLREITAPFAGYVEHLLRVSSTSLVRVDRNRYSVPARWAGRVVSVRVTANKLSLVADNEVIGQHERYFLRDQLICNPWHYFPVLEQKPGALRHVAPFVDWDLPVSIQKIREQLLQQKKGDRAFVELLLLARESGLEVLETACEQALESGVISGSVVQNEMRRLIEPPRPKALKGGDTVELTTEPPADCQRYDHLLGDRYVH